MLLSESSYNLIRDSILYLIKNIDWFDNYTLEDFDLPSEYSDELTLDETIKFNLPGEFEDFEINYGQYLEYVDEIPYLNTSSNEVIKTKLLRYYILGGIDSLEKHIFSHYYSINTVIKDNIKLSLIDKSLLVGLAALRLGEYERDYWGVISPYISIEIKYPDEKSILSTEEEKEIVKSFLFEIAANYNSVLNFSQIQTPELLSDEEIEEDIVDSAEISLETFNAGMQLFLSAMQIQEPELKYLNFYKILEHFAPVALNLEAFELMKKKLDIPRQSQNDGDYISSIFNLAKSIQNRYNDEDLIKSTFNRCFDLIGLFPKLPDSIKKLVKKQLSVQIIDYTLPTDKQSIMINFIGKIIYSTRNRVVHAKSNYNLTNTECKSEDIPELNNFMKDACIQTIRWYNRQPNHLKLSAIQ